MHEKCKIRANMSSTFPYLKHLQAIYPSFITITKLLSNTIGKSFCERFKRMCNIFEGDGQKYN